VVFTLPLSDGVEFVDVNVDQGKTSYDPESRTITGIGLFGCRRSLFLGACKSTGRRKFYFSDPQSPLTPMILTLKATSKQ